MPKKDLLGQKFGSLTVIAEAGQDKNRHVLWKVLCDCGRESIVLSNNLIRGNSKSCGNCYENSYRVSDDGSSIIMSFPDGTEFLIDIDDFERISAYTWSHSKGYALTYVDGKYPKLHRFIMNAPSNLEVDHINSDTRDNRKSNLRFATHKENSRNIRVRSDSSTGVKGVHYSDRLNKYIAYITVDSKRIHLGCYKLELEAANAYDRAAVRYFGEFARLNNLGEKTLERNAGVFSSAAK